MYNVFGDHASLKHLLQNRVFVMCISVLFAVTLWSSYTVCDALVVEVQDGDRVERILTHYSDPAQIAEQMDLALAPGDRLEFNHNSEKSADLIVNRAHHILVTYGGESVSVRLSDMDTVADALAQAGFAPDEDDIYSLSPDSRLEGVTEITVDRVDYHTYTTTETTTFDTIRAETASLTKGQSKIQVRGVEGLTEHTYCDKLINGQVAETTLLGSQVIRDVVHQEMLVGVGTIPKTSKNSGQKAVKTSADVEGALTSLTPSTPVELDENGRPVSYKQLITGKATAYTASEGGPLTATGRTVRRGLVAVNPKQIPYGSQLYIITADGSIVYGYSIAADTGGFASKGRITVDLYLDSEEDCIQFGVRNVEIYVLD